MKIGFRVGIGIVTLLLAVWVLNIPFLDSKKDLDSKKIVVSTSIVADAVKNIVGNSFQVETLIPINTIPFRYKPDEDDIQKLIDADVIIINGAGLEPSLDVVLNSIETSKKIIRLSNGINNESFIRQDFEKNSVIDPHFWFDINLWKISFMYLGDNLKVLFPKHQAEFDYRVTNYLKQLDELNNEASKIMQTIPASNRFLVAEYDAYRYIARMYKIQTFSFSKFFNSAGNERNTMDSFFSIMKNENVFKVFLDNSSKEDVFDFVIENSYKSGHPISLGRPLYSYSLGTEDSLANSYLNMMEYNIKTLVDELSVKK